MILAGVQARLGSTRLPKKVLKEINGRSIIEILLHRLAKVELIDKIMILTTNLTEDDNLVSHVSNLGYDVYRGHETDVLDRYFHCAQSVNADTIVRITGDCPLIDAQLTNDIINKYISSNVDYLSNTIDPTYPDGLDVEVISMKALEKSYENSTAPYDREHVTPYIKRKNIFKKLNYENDLNYSNERWCLDEFEDYVVIKNIFEHFSPKLSFTLEDVLELKQKYPQYFLANEHIIRDEGSKHTKGYKLWKRAKKIIPGGNMLLSKRPEMFLPEKWPTYFRKTKGCYVWDLDNQKLTDMALMGVGTNTLGYSHPKVDEAVTNVINQGNMSSLNNPDEVILAEKLIEIHPWADMARFARTGGEANAIAIRIARAAVGKDKIAICGYHGWHDWYLSANLNDNDALGEHLIPELGSNGVPQALKNTVFPFNYNQFDELEKIIQEHDIGIIKMEVIRNIEPKNDFLNKVRGLANKKGIILIFDECTSGFRENYGGIHLKYNVIPDMAMFSKALGNGYAISAIIGKETIMQSAQSTFISSIFWTERIGSAAALATLKVMKEIRSWETITEIGKTIENNWRSLAQHHNLDIHIQGLKPLLNFKIKSRDWLPYKTYISQEFLKENILASNSIYSCIDHTELILEKYFAKLDKIFSTISQCENGRDIGSLLTTPIANNTFKRHN